jgi:hypothetical protein
MNSTLPPNSVRPRAKTGHYLLLAGTSLLLGAALSGTWFHFHQATATQAENPLSAQTLNVLEHLSQPVVIRFYSLLPGINAEDELQSFAARMASLLVRVRDASDGKIQVVTINFPAETNAVAATADGVQPFNLDKSDACFLGVVISSGQRKESLARLKPEWEPAVQYDLARSIERIAASPAPAIAKPSAEILSSIQRLIPDPNTVSLEEADQIFHTEFVAECTQIGTEMEKQINTAQQELTRIQNGGSPDQIAAAQKHVLEVQLQQTDKLKQAAADLQTRLAVFQQMKVSAPEAPK